MPLGIMFKNENVNEDILIYSRFFSGKSHSDLCTLFSDHTLINRRNVTGDPHSSY